MAKKATIRTRRRGKTYSYSFDAGKNPTTGKRRAIEKGGYATEQEAYDAGVAAYADWKSGNIGITSERILLRDYLAAWLENVSRPNIAQLSYENYAFAIRMRIVPHLGGIALQDLRPRDVDAWLHKLAAEGLAAPPKTKTSTRTIHLDGHIVDALRSWKRQQSENALRLGGAYQCVYEAADGRILTEARIEKPPEGSVLRQFVCTDRFGLPVLYGAFRQMLQRHGLNAHSFRHTHATKLIEAGAKPVDVAARLGHADATITQNLYTHDTEEMRQETAAIFGNVVDKMGL